MKISIAIIFLLTIVLCSCTGTRYSSESISKDVDFENINLIEITKYETFLNKESDTSFNEFVFNEIIVDSVFVDLTIKDSKHLKSKLKYFLETFPKSRPEPYEEKELIKFKKVYLARNKIDTLDIDSVYNMSRKKRGTRNILSYRYRIRVNFHSEDEESLSIWKYADNIISYSFCCTDFKNDILYKTFKGYTAYSIEYILDIEFQKRFIELFNSVLSYYNKTNGTDYPLLDVEYEIWNGIISDY